MRNMQTRIDVAVVTCRRQRTGTPKEVQITRSNGHAVASQRVARIVSAWPCGRVWSFIAPVVDCGTARHRVAEANGREDNV